MRALEEGDGSLAGQNSEVISVGLGEEVGKGAFFFGRKVEEGLVSWCVSMRTMGEKELRRRILISLGSAMAGILEAGQREPALRKCVQTPTELEREWHASVGLDGEE